MREALRVIVFQSLSFSLQVVFMLMAARELGPDAQGVYALFRTGAYLTEGLMWLGLAGAIPYFIATDFKKYHDAMFVASGAYVLALLVLAVPIITLLLPHVGVAPSMGALAASWVVSLAAVQFFLKIFLGQRRYGLFNAISIVTSIALFPLFIYLVVEDRVTVENVMTCNILANVGGVAVAVAAHRSHLTSIRIRFEDVKMYVPQFVAVGLRGYASGIAYQLLFRADFFFVGYFCPQVLGLYSLAVFVIEAIQKVPDWLGLILSPKVSAGLDYNGETTRRFLLGAVLFVLGVGSILGVATALDVEYLVLTLGDEYRGVEIITLALIPKAVLHAAVAVCGGNLAGRGYTLFHPLSGALAVVVLVALDCGLIPAVGLRGAIIGVTTAYAVAVMVMAGGVARYSGKRAPSTGTS
jgi:O-antigen/teichoic acid export membrane protein